MVLILLCSACICLSQRTEPHLITKYTQNQGLSSYNIRNIVQDPKGFLWIASQDGLNLFDGKTFTIYNYNKPSENKLLANDVRCLQLDTGRHLIWVLTNIGGLNSIDYLTGAVKDRIPIRYEGQDDWSITMTLCNNRLWIGCMTGLKIYNISSKKWERSPVIPFPKDVNDNLYSIRTIHKDVTGHVWVFVNHYGVLLMDTASLWITDHLSIKSYMESRKLADFSFTAVADNRNGALLAGTTDGPKNLTIKSGKIMMSAVSPLIEKLLGGHHISAISRSRHAVFIADNQHLFKFTPDLISYKTVIEDNAMLNGSWLNEIYCLYADRQENLWLGCKQGLALSSNHTSPFKSFNHQNLPNGELNHLYTVFPEGDGHILIGQETGLTELDSVTNSFTIIEPLKSYNYIFRDYADRLIVSADDGLYHLQGKRLTPIATLYPELKPVASCYINSAERIGDSLYVIGSDNDRGIFIWNYRKHTLRIINNQSTPIKLKSNIVNRVFTDQKKRTWVLSDMGIDILNSRFSDVQHLSFKDPVSGAPIKLFFDICQTGKNFWLTAYGYGVINLDYSGKLISLLNSSHGLCNDGVYKIFKARQDMLLITSNNGISLLDTRQLKFNNYFEKDGLATNAFEENCGNQWLGKIYTGGLNGFSIIDPVNFFVNKKEPDLFFNTILLYEDNRIATIKNLEIKSLQIPAGTLQTTITFSGINYTNPDRVRYRYRIEGLHKTWVNLEHQNLINIIGINPGTYTLYVTAANETGIWNRKPIQLELNFIPKWYQTLWFKILILMIILGTAQLMYFYRIRQIKAKQQIRKEIAGDLHDDLGGTLNTIKIFTHMAIAEQDNKGYLQEIEASTTNASAGLRDMLWVLDDTHDTYKSLLNRILKHLNPVAEARKTNIETELDEALSRVKLSKTEKRNLLLIAKEALTNCLKYAGCTQINISVKMINKKTVISICDNGKGFNTNTVFEGYGLNNMKSRARQIHYELTLSSTPGLGTAIYLSKT